MQFGAGAVRDDEGMAVGDTIMRLARRFEQAIVGETVGASLGDASRTTYWCPRCQV